MPPRKRQKASATHSAAENTPRVFCKPDTIQYAKSEQLGTGTFGTVFAAKDEHGNVALKVPRPSIYEDERGNGVYHATLREVGIIRRIQHPNIVRLHHLLVIESDVCSSLELMQWTLGQFRMGRDGILTSAVSATIMRQLACGLRHCHEHGIMHRDVKPGNILLADGARGGDLQVRLADFGEAIRVVPGRLNTQCIGTLWYRAPEIHFGDLSYGIAVDLWAFGCIYAEIRSGCALFVADDDAALLEALVSVLGTPTEKTWKGVSKLRDLGKRGKRPARQGPLLNQRLTSLTTEESSLVQSLVVWDPTKRATIEDVCRHFESRGGGGGSLKPGELTTVRGSKRDLGGTTRARGASSLADAAALVLATPGPRRSPRNIAAAATGSSAVAAAAAPLSAASSAPTAKTTAACAQGACAQHPVAWYAVADANFMRGHDVVTERMRAILVDWLIVVAHKFKLVDGTLHLCVNLIDRYLQADKFVPSERLQLLGVVALLIATKLLETHPVTVSDLVFMADHSFTAFDVKMWELVMLEKLDGDILVCTLSTALDERLDALETSGLPPPPSLQPPCDRLLARYLADLTLVDSRSCELQPEQLARACVSLASPHAQMDEQTQTASAAAMVHLRDLHSRAKDGAHFAGIRRKHALCEQRHLSCA